MRLERAPVPDSGPEDGGEEGRCQGKVHAPLGRKGPTGCSNKAEVAEHGGRIIRILAPLFRFMLQGAEQSRGYSHTLCVLL